MQRSESVLCCLQSQRGAELCLSTGTLQKDDQIACHSERRGTAEVLFHERERQVDSGCHARRSPDWTVTYENRVRFDMHIGKALGKPGAIHPVSRCAAPVQYASRSQEESTRADRGDASCPRRSLPHPVDQNRILCCCLRSFAAGD